MQDTPTFEEAYTKHRRKIFSLCYRMVKDPTDAEDLVQDVFIQVHRKMNTFRGESTFSTWLYRLAVNVVCMKLRSNQRKWNKKIFSLEAMLDITQVEIDPHRLDRALQIEDKHLNQTVERIALLQAIERMPPGYKLFFDLVCLNEFTHKEVAALMDVSLGDSKSQVHKAKKWLTNQLKVNQSQVVSVAIEEDQSLDQLLDNFDQWLEDD